jgi:hypothetical protein
MWQRWDSTLSRAIPKPVCLTPMLTITHFGELMPPLQVNKMHFCDDHPGLEVCWEQARWYLFVEVSLLSCYKELLELLSRYSRGVYNSTHSQLEYLT